MARGVKTGGRQKGTPNKTTALLKDAILQAAEAAGDGDLVAYLTVQARANPAPFMSLLGKVLPLQVTGGDGEPLIPQPDNRQLARAIVAVLGGAAIDEDTTT
jgi:hypothetical protein